MCEYLILGADVFFGPKSGDTLNSWVILVFHIIILYIIAAYLNSHEPIGVTRSRGAGESHRSRNAAAHGLDALGPGGPVDAGG